MANGEKFYASSSNTNIFKKIERPLQDSIYRATNNELSNSIIHIFKVLQNKVLICTNTATYIASINEIATLQGSTDIPNLTPVRIDTSSRDVVLHKQCSGNGSSIFFVGGVDSANS